MSIDPNIVIGVSTVLGAAIGGAISLLSARRQSHIEALTAQAKKLERDYVHACEQIAAFHRLEEIHSREHAAIAGKTENQVKLEMRKILDDEDIPRPRWSARDARNAIKEISG